MTLEEAKKIISKHGSGYLHTPNEVKEQEKGLIGMLRPFRGIKWNYFSEFIDSFIYISEEFTYEKVNKELIHSILTTSSSLREIALSEFEPMFHGTRPIKNSEQTVILRWSLTIEKILMYLLDGESKEQAFLYLASYIDTYKWELNSKRLATLFSLYLENSLDEDAGFFDDEIIVCRALENMKVSNTTILGSLKKVIEKKADEELSQVALQTLTSLNKTKN